MIVEERRHLTFKKSQSIGALISYQFDTFSFMAQTETEKIRVSVYSDQIIRVQVTRNDDFDPFEYALQDGLQPKQYDYLEKDDCIVISTGVIEVLVMKDPFRIVFKNNQGKIINEDEDAFGISWIGDQVSNYKKLQPDEKFIGLGEKTGPLNRRGHGYQNWNTDHFGYDLNTDPIYCSIPFYMGVHNELAYGIFFNNSYKTHFNFGASNNRFSSFSADAGDLDYFFFHDQTVAGIISSYSDITGKMTLPPKWSIGYQQCRYSYYPDKEVLNTAQTFRDKDIPADVIVLDIHYMDKYKIFSWDKEHFPDPASMIKKLEELGFKVVVMCDPGIKIEEGYSAYDEGVADDVFIKYPDNSYYEGEVWPGWCHFPDFTNPKSRDWWQKQLQAYSEIGIEGYWNDMNEIATWGQMLPELIEFDFDGESGTTRNGRNIYGLMMARSTFEGSKKNLKGKRPFNLTRSGFSGIQRYAAVWTGDNVASDEHMLLGVRLVNSLGLSGVPFTGFDAGGFVGNASESLFARWISVAAFTPFFRGHSMINSRDSEPWSFGETVEEISKNYITLRYRLMPYVYSQFFSSSQTGVPINRSLAIDYPHEDNVYHETYENQFMFGPSLLVAPVESKAKLEKVFLPNGKWYELYNDQVHDGNGETVVDCPIEKLPVFVKASSILPVQPKVSSNQECPGDILEIHLYNGTDINSFTYYEDDGESYEYENGLFHKREITFDPINRSLVFDKAEGLFESGFHRAKIYFHGFDTSKFNGMTLKTEDYRFINRLSIFDPSDFSQPVDYKIDHLPYTEIELTNEQVSIDW